MKRDITYKPTRRQFFLAAAAAATTVGTLRPNAARAADKCSVGKAPFQLGLASYSTRKFSLEETLAMANRVGLKYICLKSFHLPLGSTPEQIAQAVEKVKKAGIVLYGGGVIGMRDAKAVDLAFEYAKAAGMKTIVGVPAPDLLPLVDKKVKEYDIEVAIHNHGPGDKTYPTPESAYEKIKDLDKRIGLCMDIGHTVRYGECPVRDARRFADRLLDVHLKDVSEASKKGRTVEIGRGVIDIPAFLRALVEIKYSRVASFEYEKDPDDPLAGLAESVGYVNGVLATIA